MTVSKCRVKKEYHIDGDFQTIDVVYHCRVTSPESQKFTLSWQKQNGRKGIIIIKVIQPETTLKWGDNFKLCVAPERNFRCNY